ncbi:MAG: SsrA-binding protein SmpB [Planctomycetota bacterium]|nr:SsrA-binding protein SmpB [Planctomycetota bacterium]
MAGKGNQKKNDAPEVHNRRARHEYAIDETLEVGIKLVGTEVRSLRAGKGSLAEGYVRAELEPPRLLLFGVHIDEYAPAGPVRAGRQHALRRARVLLAHGREIRKLYTAQQTKGVTIVPLRLYFNERGIAKVLIGVGRGKKAFDKREDIKKRETQREIQRQMSRRL